MSCFKLPESICKGIKQECTKFWWNDKEGKKGMHWMSWERLCRPKFHGGMSFRNLRAFCKAWLAKQVWRVIYDPTSLLARVLKARYFKHTDILSIPILWRQTWVLIPRVYGGLYCGGVISLKEDYYVGELEMVHISSLNMILGSQDVGRQNL
ncbi:putative mitochondrial protein AtMg00310 [Primulina tabacum]|uniref:putative mitochondrial protein AtMg00310 n=1 Tax=Primulina tabacum TaxID=48773 RepID=UPI003F5A2663